MSAKTVAEAILSVAGTMVWSKRIAIAYLQVVWLLGVRTLYRSRPTLPALGANAYFIKKNLLKKYFQLSTL
jgi:hypothetical protein